MSLAPDSSNYKLQITNMSDALFLSLWFPNFEPAEILPRTLSVLRQFPYSAQRPGISYLAIHPVNWSEARKGAR